SVHKRGKQLLLFEGGKANSIEENVVEEGVNGIKRILSHLEMRSFKIDISEGRSPVLLRDSKWMRAPISGLFQVLVENGKPVAKGDVLGLVTDPYGKLEKKIKAV